MKVITYKLQAVWGPICFLSETKFDDATFEKFWVMESHNLTNLVVSIIMIRNASDFYSFCQESVTHKNKQSSVDNSFLLNQMNQVFWKTK